MSTDLIVGAPPFYSQRPESSIMHFYPIEIILKKRFVLKNTVSLVVIFVVTVAAKNGQ